MRSVTTQQGRTYDFGNEKVAQDQRKFDVVVVWRTTQGP